MTLCCRSCIEDGYVGEGFPVWNHLLGYVSHVLLCFVPTANFLVYCVVGNKFRYILYRIYFTHECVLVFRMVANIYIRKMCCCAQSPRQELSPYQGSLRSSGKTISSALQPAQLGGLAALR